MSTIGGPRLSTIPPTFFNDYSFEFDGVDDYVQPSTQTSIEDTSFSCWIKTTETFVYTDSRCAFGGRASLNGGNYTLGRLGSAFSSPNDMKVRCFNTLGTTKLNDDMWHHIVFTHDFTTKETKAYVDGNLEVTVTFPANSNLFNVAIGWNGFASSTFFEGLIDECAWFTSVLTLSDINTIYGTGIPNDISSLNPKAWYRMGDNGVFRDPQWLIPNNENKDKASNYSLSFDGANDYIDCGVINQVQTFSYSVWVNPTNWSATRVLMQQGQSSNYGVSFWFMSNGTLRCIGANGTNDSYFGNIVVNADTILPSGQWGHILFTHEKTGTGATQKIYINGTLRNTYISTTNPYTIDYLGNPLYIARRNNSTAYWLGKIDEVAIWNSDQSTNVSTIYNGGVPSDLSSLNPIAYYKMGENATFKDPQWLLPSNENKDKTSNYSMNFDGTDDVVVINNTLGITNGLTMSCWVKFATTITSTNWLCSAGGTGGSNGHFNTRLAANGVWVNYLNGGPFFVLGLDSTALKDGNWHHIAQTIDYSNAEMRFYQDGVESTSIRSINTGTTATKINQIGGASSTPTFPFTGNIDEFAILEGAKSLAEIQEIYNDGLPMDLTSLSPLAYYKMGEDATFDGTNWAIPDIVGSSPGTSANMGIDDRVGDSPSSSGNTLSYNMDINDRVGDAPNSENNALGYNMVLSGRTTDIPT